MSSKYFKAILLIFLICSTSTIEVKKTTEVEKEVFAELSKYGYVVMDSINPEKFKAPKSSDLSLRQNEGVVLIVCLVIEAVCLLWKGIVKIFGYSVSVRYTDVPMDQGYQSLSQKVSITYLAGSRPGNNCENFPKIINALSKLVGLKEGTDNYKAFTRAFEHAKYADTKTWGKKSFFFGSPDQPGKVDYISIMINKLDDEDYVPGPDTGEDEPLCTDHEKYYILFIFLKAAFTPNADIRIETTEEHWGIWRDRTTSKILYLPRGVTKEDIEQLFKFFDLVGLKALKDKYDVEAPEVQIKIEGK